MKQQFYKIRDDVLRKARTADRAGKQPEGAEAQNGEDESAKSRMFAGALCFGCPAHVSDVMTGPDAALSLKAEGTALEGCDQAPQVPGYAAASDMAISTPNLRRNTVAIADSARHDGAREQAQATVDTDGFCQAGGMQAGGCIKPSQCPPPQSPEVFDLQTLYHSPAHSSSEAVQQISPFESLAAGNKATSYNVLYGKASARETIRTPPQDLDVQELRLKAVHPLGASTRMDAFTSTPGTDRVFSHQSLLEACAKVSDVAPQWSVHQQQQQNGEQGPVNGLSLHMLAWQVTKLSHAFRCLHVTSQ